MQDRPLTDQGLFPSTQAKGDAAIDTSDRSRRVDDLREEREHERKNHRLNLPKSSGRRCSRYSFNCSALNSDASLVLGAARDVLLSSSSSSSSGNTSSDSAANIGASRRSAMA